MDVPLPGSGLLAPLSELGDGAGWADLDRSGVRCTSKSTQ